MPAASAPSTFVCSKTLMKSSGPPAPPEAIIGIEHLVSSDCNNSISYPSLTPSFPIALITTSPAPRS